MYSPTLNEGPFLSPSWSAPLDSDALRADLMQREQLTANAVNLRTIGVFQELTTATGEQWQLPGIKTSSIRKAYLFPAGPNAGTVTQAHNITQNNRIRFTRIYGAATRETPFEAIPVPYVGTNALEIRISGANIVLESAANYSTYQVLVVLEFLNVAN